MRTLPLSLGLQDGLESFNLGDFVKQTDGNYRVRLRSKYLPINEIAKRHDGGGHPLASGANSYSLSENEQIYQEIQEVVRNASK